MLSFITNAKEAHDFGLYQKGITLPNGSVRYSCSCADCTIKSSISPLIRGRPKATDSRTIEQLEEIGLIGLYKLE